MADTQNAAAATAAADTSAPTAQEVQQVTQAAQQQAPAAQTQQTQTATPPAQQQATPQQPQQQQQQQAQSKAANELNDLFNEQPKQEEQAEVPDTYTFDPGEGAPITEEETASYSKIAKSLGLTQEKAQAFFEQARQEQAATLEHFKAQWSEQAMNDAEIGGTHIADTKANVTRFLNAYATPEFKNLMRSTGLGTNPEILRVLARAGAKLAADNKFISGNGHVTQKADPYAYMTKSPELK